MKTYSRRSVAPKAKTCMRKLTRERPESRVYRVFLSAEYKIKVSKDIHSNHSEQPWRIRYRQRTWHSTLNFSECRCVTKLLVQIDKIYHMKGFDVAKRLGTFIPALVLSLQYHFYGGNYCKGRTFNRLAWLLPLSLF